MAATDPFAAEIARISELIKFVRQFANHPTYHIAYQPANPDGAVYVMATDMSSMNASQHPDQQPIQTTVSEALAELYSWAQSEPEAALEFGLIVAGDQPDADLLLWPGVVITAGQLANLRRFQIKLVVFASRQAIARG